MGVIAKTISEMNKVGNPNHGPDGRFSSGDGGEYKHFTGQSVSDSEGNFKVPWKKGPSTTENRAGSKDTFTQTMYHDPKSPQHHFVHVVQDHATGEVTVDHTGKNSRSAWGSFKGEGATDRASAYLKDKFGIDHKF